MQINAMTIDGVEYDVVKTESRNRCHECDMEKLGAGKCMFYILLDRYAQCPLVYNGVDHYGNIVEWKSILKRRRSKDDD